MQKRRKLCFLFLPNVSKGDYPLLTTKLYLIRDVGVKKLLNFNIKYKCKPSSFYYIYHFATVINFLIRAHLRPSTTSFPLPLLTSCMLSCKVFLFNKRIDYWKDMRESTKWREKNISS